MTMTKTQEKLIKFVVKNFHVSVVRDGEDKVVKCHWGFNFSCPITKTDEINFSRYKRAKNIIERIAALLGCDVWTERGYRGNKPGFGLGQPDHWYIKSARRPPSRLLEELIKEVEKAKS